MFSWFSGATRPDPPKICQIIPRFFEITLLDGDADEERSNIEDAAKWLSDNFKGRSMVWNLVPGVQGDVFENQVQFTKSRPTDTPVLEELLRVSYSMRSWLECDEDNVVAVITDQTPLLQSWSLLIISCYLLYTSQDLHIASAHVRVAASRASPIGTTSPSAAAASSPGGGKDDLGLITTIKESSESFKSADGAGGGGAGAVGCWSPSMRRHLLYLRYMQEIVARRCLPVASPMFLHRVIMHGIPFAALQSIRRGICPVFQVLDAATGRLIASSPKTRFYDVEEFSAVIRFEARVVGDVILRLVHCHEGPIQVKSNQTRAAAQSPNHKGGGTPIPAQEGGSCDGNGATLVVDVEEERVQGGGSVKEEGGGVGGIANVVGVSSPGGGAGSAENGRLSGSENVATDNRGIASEEGRRSARGGWRGGVGATLFSYAFHTGLAPVVGSIDDAGNSTSGPPGWLEEGKGKREGGGGEQSGVISLTRSDLDIHASDTRFVGGFQIDLLYSFGDVTHETAEKVSDHDVDEDDSREAVEGADRNVNEGAYKGADRNVKEVVSTELLTVVALIDKIDVFGRRPSLARPVLQVTPNPRDYLPSGISAPSTDSLPVIFSFESPKANCEVEIRGLALLLPSLLVLEPLKSEEWVHNIGVHSCRVRVPLERVTLCQMQERPTVDPPTTPSRIPPPDTLDDDQDESEIRNRPSLDGPSSGGGNSSCLVIEWDVGDDAARRRVVISDTCATTDHGHVHGLSEAIKGHIMALEEHVRDVTNVEELMPDNPELSTESMILKGDDAAKIRGQLPLRFRWLDRWELVYSTKAHGISFSTFLRNAELVAPTLMIIKDEAHASFGAFCSSPWEPHPTFFGTGESFVFTVRPEFGVYRWQPGLNQHFMLCRKGEGIAIGGGGANAIRLEPDFLLGASGECTTFDSPSLAASTEFNCLFMEMWSFREG